MLGCFVDKSPKIIIEHSKTENERTESMGLAASQARYLALSARKANCEYEGQQINQQRLNLSNQSADLFNQMLTMAVPMPPNTTDYTRVQYSWSDGDMTYVMEDFYQLSEPDSQYNYVTTSYHFEKVYTGQRKFLIDPQIQATKTNHFSDPETKNYKINSISYNREKDTYTFEATNPLGQKQTLYYSLSDQNKDKDVVEQLDVMYNSARIDSTNTDATKYSRSGNTITYTDGSTTKAYTYVDTENDAEGLKKLKQTYGAFYDSTKHYYKSDDDTYVCQEEIENVQATHCGNVTVRKQDLNDYYTDGKYYVSLADIHNLNIGDTLTVITSENNPTFSDYTAVGNCPLTILTDEMYSTDIAIQTEIKQIIEDMGKDGGDAVAYERLKACFDDNGNYINGSIYEFTMAGQTYLTTTADMDASLISAYSLKSVANNSIDSQQTRLSYYDALKIDTKVTETKKALLESDGNGRFSTAKFEDDSVVYTLNVETYKDDDAYNDAMNKYYYEKEEYDKNVADINAKTEILQAQDRQLQLKLEQLNTEQSALQTEMEACQKVVSKNIDEGFKTFSS